MTNQGKQSRQAVKFYDQIAIESARAIVHVNRSFEAERGRLNEKHEGDVKSVEKWRCYWERNVTQIKGFCLF